MAKPFKNLLKDMSPERLNRIEERVEQMLLEMVLQEKRADEAIQEWIIEPSTARPNDEFRTELIEEGLLDD